MIWHDGGHGVTPVSLKFFREHREHIGSIVRVIMLDYNQGDEWIGYPFRIVGEEGEIWLSGCVAGYCGTGPNSSVTVLRELNYFAPYCYWPVSRAEFELGPPSKPEIPVESVGRVELTEAHEEVLDVIKAYRREYGKMPTVREIVKLCDLTTRGTVWQRLSDLEAAGRIERQSHKARAIKILGGEASPK